ncbi:MAG: hypothetical protein ACR2JY_13545 [Chloroflexota bacterium]
MDDDAMAEAMRSMQLGRATLIYDRARGRPLLHLRGVVVLPVGATVELAGGGTATVVGVRLLAGAGDPAQLYLDVQVPADGGEAEAAVPAPIAAATAGLDLDPDAAKPLGTPLSSAPASVPG